VRHHETHRALAGRERLPVPPIGDQDDHIPKSGVQFRKGEHHPVAVCRFDQQELGELTRQGAERDPRQLVTTEQRLPKVSDQTQRRFIVP